MDHRHMLAALMFGVALIAAEGDPEPIFTATRSTDRRRLMISPRKLNTNEPHEKDVVTSVVAMAMRAWGATEIMFLADAYVIHTNDRTEAEILPSENPRYIDALIVNIYRADGPDEGVYVPHHLDDQGRTIFEDIQVQPPPPPESEVPAITDQSRFPALIHRALRMTDEQVKEVLAKTPEPEGPWETVEQMFEVMRGEGYVVEEGDG